MDERERKKLLDEMGGEPLEGSGFEPDTPDFEAEAEHRELQEEEK